MSKNNIALSFDFTSDYDRKFSIEFTTNTNGQKQAYSIGFATNTDGQKQAYIKTQEGTYITLTKEELVQILSYFSLGAKDDFFANNKPSGSYSMEKSDTRTIDYKFMTKCKKTLDN